MGTTQLELHHACRLASVPSSLFKRLNCTFKKLNLFLDTVHKNIVKGWVSMLKEGLV